MKDTTCNPSEDNKDAKKYLEKLKQATKKSNPDNSNSEDEQELSDHHKSVLAQVLLQQMATE